MSQYINYNQSGQPEELLDDQGQPLNPTKEEWEKAFKKYMGNNQEKGKYKKRNTYNCFRRSGDIHTFGNPLSAATAKQSFIRILQQTVREERKAKKRPKNGIEVVLSQRLLL